MDSGDDSKWTGRIDLAIQEMYLLNGLRGGNLTAALQALLSDFGERVLRRQLERTMQICFREHS